MIVYLGKMSLAPTHSINVYIGTAITGCAIELYSKLLWLLGNNTWYSESEAIPGIGCKQNEVASVPCIVMLGNEQLCMEAYGGVGGIDIGGDCLSRMWIDVCISRTNRYIRKIVATGIVERDL